MAALSLPAISFATLRKGLFLILTAIELSPKAKDRAQTLPRKALLRNLVDKHSRGSDQMPTRKAVFEKLNRTKKLPTPSGTTLQVIRLCRNEGTSLGEIARVIETDPALSAEMLKYANAAFLSTGVQIASIQKATVKLGLNNVVALALGLSLLAKNKKGKCAVFDYDIFWSTSLLQAIAAKNIALFEKRLEPEELFICALLSHMGQLALASLFPKEYEAMLSEFGFSSCGEWENASARKAMADSPSNMHRKTLEKDTFQIDSSELTFELFLDWGLPTPYALAAGFHDDLDSIELGTGTTQKIAELFNLAHHIAKICHHPQSAKEQLVVIESTAGQFNLGERDFATVFDAIISQWHEVGEIFNIRTKQCLLYNEIMTENSEERR